MIVEKHLAAIARDFYDRRATVDTVETPISHLLAQLDGDDPAVRRRALDGLAQRFAAGEVDEVTLERVIEHGMALRGRMDNERRATLRAIGYARNEELLQQFVPLLGTGQSEALWVASLVLGYARFVPAVVPLTNALTNATDIEADALAWALGQIGTRDALTVLQSMVDQGFQQRAAAMALACGGHIKAVDMVAAMLRSESCEDTLVGVLGLLRLAEEHGSDPRLAIGLGRARDAIEACTRHPSPTIATHAFQCLITMSKAPPHVRLAQSLTDMPRMGNPPITEPLN